MNMTLASLAIVLLAAVGSASAGVIYTGGTGATSYGATRYTCAPCAGAPQFIGNNVTGLNDILSSPGGGYQVANPVIGNNVAQTGIVNAPYFIGWQGGVSGDGSAFGSGVTVNNGPTVGFALNDTTVGGGTASYMITSMLNTFTVDNAGYNGTIGDFLSIAGNNFAGPDASVAAIRGSVSVNNGAGGVFALPDLILALSGGCNNVATGTAFAVINAACTNGGNGGNFAGLAIGLANGGAAFNLAAGTQLSVVTTLTLYADPASFDSIDLSDALFQQLLQTTGPLPGFSVNDTGVEGSTIPEPGTFVALCGALLALGLTRRKRA